ncbi:glycerophosphodiester phosphodiesterase [Streptacidiphilus sp. 4-A2]|nr:glycerophosphodiester phosphodiesterase [Streptacidiphilus sp. 4-A2]
MRTLDCLDWTVFTGIPEALARIREQVPAAVIAMSWESPLPPRAELVRRVRPDYFNQYYRWLTAGRIARLHRAGMKVSTWTVDRPATMAALAAAGVDAIISNDLRALRRALATGSGRPARPPRPHRPLRPADPGTAAGPRYTPARPPQRAPPRPAARGGCLDSPA